MRQSTLFQVSLHPLKFSQVGIQFCSMLTFPDSKEAWSSPSLAYLEVLISFHLYPGDCPSFYLRTYPSIYPPTHSPTHESNQPPNQPTNRHLFNTRYQGYYSKQDGVYLCLIAVIVWQILIKHLLNATFTVQNLFKSLALTFTLSPDVLFVKLEWMTLPHLGTPF